MPRICGDRLKNNASEAIGSRSNEIIISTEILNIVAVSLVLNLSVNSKYNVVSSKHSPYLFMCYTIHWIIIAKKCFFSSFFNG